VFREVASGAKTDRAQLRRVLDELDADDLPMVTRLDRLARSTLDLLNTLAAITAKSRFPFARRRMGRHHHGTCAFYADRFRLGGLAEFERYLIRTRTGEGRERANARGVKFGRKPRPNARSARRFAGATRTASRCAKLPPATTSRTARFTADGLAPLPQRTTN
jgi:DNA invertase Pin-like site-specific DNA recombinase